MRQLTDAATRDDLERLNPWHESGEVGRDRVAPVERRLAQLLWRRLTGEGARRYQVIQGPRRAGKSTVLLQTVRRLLARGVDPAKIWWVQMDAPDMRRHGLSEVMEHVVAVSGASADRPAFVMIDDVDRVQDWRLWLKGFHDDSWPVEILAAENALAASQVPRTDPGIGRWDEQRLLPCSFSEFIDLCPLPSRQPPRQTAADHLNETLRALPAGPYASSELDEARNVFMLVGAWPDLLLQARRELDAHGVGDQPAQAGPGRGGGAARPDQRSRADTFADNVRRSHDTLRSAIVDRVIFRDIRESPAVDDPRQVEDLLHSLADPVTSLMAPGAISRIVGAPQAAVHQYKKLLEGSYLTFDLSNFADGVHALEPARSKVYFWDTAVRNAVLRRGAAALARPGEYPGLLENLAASTLRSLGEATRSRVCYWGDGGEVVGLIYDDLGGPIAFDVASSASGSRSGLRALADAHAKFAGQCYLVAPDAELISPDRSDDGVGSLPLNAFLLGVGAQIQLAVENRVGLPPDVHQPAGFPALS